MARTKFDIDQIDWSEVSSGTIISGGNPPGGGTTDVTEEFTAADFEIKTVTTS